MRNRDFPTPDGNAMTSAGTPHDPVTDADAFCHPTALCETARIGSGTRIWAHAHIMPGAAIGSACNICDQVFVESGASIGNRVTVKNRALIFAGVTIGDDVFVGPGVVFTNDRYPRSPRMPEASPRYASPSHWREDTTVERGVSIGAGAVIGCGLRLGAFATIGAGAVVTRDVASYALVAGNPARQIRWVCRCGLALPSQLLCTGCQRRYTVAAGTLSEISDQKRPVPLP